MGDTENKQSGQRWYRVEYRGELYAFVKATDTDEAITKFVNGEVASPYQPIGELWGDLCVATPVDDADMQAVLSLAQEQTLKDIILQWIWEHRHEMQPGPEPCALLDLPIRKLLVLLRTQSITNVEVVETWKDEGEACATVRFIADDGQRFCVRLWWIGAVGVGAFKYADTSPKAQATALSILHERVHLAIIEKFEDIKEALAGVKEDV